MDTAEPYKYSDYCLAHLFTAYAFSNAVLGLAYIASPSKGMLGGICSGSYYDVGIKHQIYLNTGWSSALNKDKEKILTQEAEIVLAHELGTSKKVTSYNRRELL